MKFWVLIRWIFVDFVVGPHLVCFCSLGCSFGRSLTNLCVKQLDNLCCNRSTRESTNCFRANLNKRKQVCSQKFLLTKTIRIVLYDALEHFANKLMIWSSYYEPDTAGTIRLKFKTTFLQSFDSYRTIVQSTADRSLLYTKTKVYR